jgi:hypothetical protein
MTSSKKLMGTFSGLAWIPVLKGHLLHCRTNPSPVSDQLGAAARNETASTQTGRGRLQTVNCCVRTVGWQLMAHNQDQ